jgi:hypothetical protein
MVLQGLLLNKPFGNGGLFPGKWELGDRDSKSNNKPSLIFRDNE